MNRFHLSGDITFGAPLGGVHSVSATAVPGREPYVSAHFVKGGRLELSVADADALAQQLGKTVAIAKQRSSGDLSGSRADLGGEQ